jgi:hypothetical protein
MNLPLLTANVAVYRSSVKYRYHSAPARNVGITLSQSLPNGTYLQSCFGCTVEGFVEGANLSCQCKDFNGNLQQTSINPDICGSADIANCDGNLICGPCGF